MRYKDMKTLQDAIRDGDAEVVWNPGDKEANVLPTGPDSHSDEYLSPSAELQVGRIEQLTHGDEMNLDRLLEVAKRNKAHTNTKDEMTEARRQIEKVKREHLQTKFNYWWNLFAGTNRIVPEHRFHTSRKWRIDFAIVEVKIGYEVNGGTYQDKGGHNWGPHMTLDYEKWNAATMAGWHMFYFTPDMLTKKMAPTVFPELIHWAHLSLLEWGYHHDKDR